MGFEVSPNSFVPSHSGFSSSSESVPGLRVEICPFTFIYVYTNVSPFIFVVDIQKKQPDSDCAPKPPSSSSSSQADIFCNDTNSSISQSLMSMPSTSEDPSPGEMGGTSLPAQDGKTAVISEMLILPVFSLSLISIVDVGPLSLY